MLSAELRADFTFHAEFSGDLKLTINDAVVLEGKGEGDKTVTGKTVRLNKGANNLVAEFTSCRHMHLGQVRTTPVL